MYYAMKTNWAKIKQKYITENVSLKELASEFSLSESSLMKRAANEKWTDEKKKYCRKVEDKIQERVADEIAKAYQEVVLIAKKELIEEAKLIVEIRKNIGEDTQYAESRVNKCTATIKEILNTLEHHAYPQREDKADNNITVVLSDDKMKEYFQ